MLTSLAQNQLAEELMNKLETKTATIGVVGLGYVGLPLAVEKAKAGYNVIGFDVQQARANMVNEGVNYIGDVVDEELSDIVSKGRLKAVTDYSFIHQTDAVAICVPTPLDNYQQPDTSYVVSSAKAIAQNMKKGMLIVLESTTYPGTTEELLKPILEESGLKCGEDFFLAYSPERVDPGNKDFNTKNTPKVVGGMTEACTEVAAALYENVLEGKVHKVSHPSVAEMEKILENTFRNINIGLANEMAILCNKMGIDVWEVIDAAATKPYGFMPFYPGPGLGGHCIPIDPWYLTWKAREYNYHTRLIEIAGEINNSMPEFVVQRCTEILNEQKKSLKGAGILVLGVAYKPNISDCRQSPSIDIIRQLKSLGAELTVCDPHVEEYKIGSQIYSTETLTEEAVETADLVLILTNHDGLPYDSIMSKGQAILDTRNSYKDKEKTGDHYYKL